jgi:putative ABC transport system substrate-binding protein
MMRRREFITIASGAAMGPVVARAQQSAMPVVGLLRSTPAAPFARLVAAVRQGLGDEGLVEGRSIALEQRWADNQRDRLPGLVAELVQRQVAAIITHGPAISVARAATSTTPIIFVIGDDPVKMGFVASLNRPERNLTGITFYGGGQLGAKRLELLRELVPKASVVAILLDPQIRGFETELPLVQAAGQTLGFKTVLVRANVADLEATFADIVQAGADSILLGGGPALASKGLQIARLAARHKIPTIYELKEYVETGGLISYAASISGAYRQAGVYAGKIIKGAKPIDLPVLQPTTFELAINLSAAKALGLAVPPSIMLRADEVIE